MENKKNKKIFARVGAMVAAVLLVALCALPAFADDFVIEIDEWWYYEKFYEYYGLDDVRYPLRTIMDEGLSVQEEYLSQFTVPDVGTPYERTQYVTLNTRSEYLGRFAFWNYSPPGEYGVYDNCYLTTSHTTVNGNKFVYFDVQQQDSSGTFARVLRIRIKIDNTSGEIVSAVVDGVHTGGDASTYIFAVAVPHEYSNVLEYAYSFGFLTPEISVDWSTFRELSYKAYSDGYHVAVEQVGTSQFDRGYAVGYDDGMGQTSLLDGVTAIFRAPMDLIDGVLNFELFGINMAVAVRVLITMAIIGVCVTIIWKAVK